MQINVMACSIQVVANVVHVQSGSDEEYPIHTQRGCNEEGYTEEGCN